jgi:hypothetical protein
MKFFSAAIIFLENFNNGKPLFFIIELVSIIFRLKHVKLEHVEKLSALSKKILNSRLRLGYKVNFLNLNLISAYKLRLFHFACIANGAIKGDSKLSKNYLSVVGSNEFLDYLNLNNEVANYIKKIKKNNPSNWDINPQEKKIIGKTILIGPSIDILSVNLSLYETVIFIKPPKANLILKNKNIIVILNNAWIKKEIDSIYSWLQDHPSTNFISPQDIESIGILKENFLENLLLAPFGVSPMGLQRALFIIKNKYTFEKLTIIGFNLSLSRDPYHESYPSLIKTLGAQKDVILWSNAVHDFYYNFYLTKSLLNNDQRIESNLQAITKKPISYINDLFIESFK